MVRIRMMAALNLLALAALTLMALAALTLMALPALAQDKPASPAASPAAAADNDPYLWLADIQGPRALAWVKAQTAKSDAVLTADPFYAAARTTILTTLNAPGRIAEPNVKAGYVYNFWQDSAHVRGLWRRAAVASYNSGHPAWQTLLDMDAYDAKAGKPYVFAGANCVESFARCLIRLSPGGGDAVVIREFDPKAGAFFAGGFTLPAAKSSAEYLDDNAILFDTDFGPGTMTKSSYPRIVKLWHRGTPIAEAKTVFEGRVEDNSVGARVFHDGGRTIALIARRPSFFRADYQLLTAAGRLVPVAVPPSAELRGITAGQMIFSLREAWAVSPARTLPAGALISIAVPDAKGAASPAAPAVLFTPGKGETAGDVGAGRDAVYAAIFKNVIGEVRAFRFAHGAWQSKTLSLPKGGSSAIASVNNWGPDAYIRFESFTQPPALYATDGMHAPKKIYALPARYDASKVSVAQHWIVSKDGTKVPYFLIRPKGAKGPLPTILYGYGGFELSLFPWYWDDGHRPLDALQAWVGKGGAIAVANIRGGGEFGPAWHSSVLKFNRQKAYDDFEGVAEDIEAHHWSSPKQLGIVGASNGGLLVTTAMTERPDLFGAVVCQRPLIDMIRYTHYGAGASWIAEYGDPADAKMRGYILTYSPYQNVKADKSYPPVLFITETTDDRVTPVFARMMAAKMEAQGHTVLFNEAAEGGHGPGATHAQEAEYWAQSYTFFQQTLGLSLGLK